MGDGSMLARDVGEIRGLGIYFRAKPRRCTGTKPQKRNSRGNVFVTSGPGWLGPRRSDDVAVYTNERFLDAPVGRNSTSPSNWVTRRAGRATLGKILPGVSDRSIGARGIEVRSSLAISLFRRAGKSADAEIDPERGGGGGSSDKRGTRGGNLFANLQLTTNGRV